MKKRIINFIRFTPLFLLGVAMIVWTTIFHRNTGKDAHTQPDNTGLGPDDAIFPY